jgi:hypothetical protein
VCLLGLLILALLGEHASRNGELHLVNDRGVEHGSHAHLSAIVLREQSVGAGLPAVTMDVFETISGQCVPLPATVFAHEGDTRLGPRPWPVRSAQRRHPVGRNRQLRVCVGILD